MADYRLFDPDLGRYLRHLEERIALLESRWDTPPSAKSAALAASAPRVARVSLVKRSGVPTGSRRPDGRITNIPEGMWP
ncbi:hypothetical protein ABT160_23570 [Streptomyces sp. NPDC001941]|uniref:hypothetical protein n=1 Tax=Streptomyces sp. NPDC001941 TaxID=3154659 RepID=UPI0033241587